MANPTTRVLVVLELLQSHGMMSGAELARRLEVTPRTLRRYIVTLESLGIPVLAERGRDGGYRLMQGFKLPPMMFNNEEALALALGLLAAGNLGLAETTVAGAGALAKLERVMPENLRQRVRAIGEVVTLNMKRAVGAGDPEVLATLSVAAQSQQRVHLRYRVPGQAQTAREVDPYGLAFWEGNWYVVGYCHLRQDRRSFRLDRVDAVSALPAYFGRPLDFNALSYLVHAVAALPRAHTVRVLLHTDMDTARSTSFTSLGMLEAVQDGVMLHSQVDDLAWMARELARMPFAFRIQEPTALKEAVGDHARTLLAMGAIGVSFS
ncbi:MAG: helix-turn-helix transcriptional regulator [Massilia sp.]